MMDHLSNGIVSQWVFHINEESKESNLSSLSVINNITLCPKAYAFKFIRYFLTHFAKYYFMESFTRLVFPNDESKRNKSAI